MKACHALLLLAIAYTSTACATRSEIAGSWKDPEYQGGAFRKLLVIGVGRNADNSRLFEETLAQALQAKGATAASGYRVLPAVEQLSEDDIRQTVKQGQYDAVIVTRLLAVDQETQYVAPRTYVVGTGAPARSYYGYYVSSWHVVREPGYLSSKTIVRLETNLYDSRTARLVWSGRSNTFDPKSVGDAIDSVTRALTERLVQEGMIGS